MKLEVATADFAKALNAFAEKMQRDLGGVVKDEARLLAERLRRLTPPSTQAQGKKRVETDIRRTFQQNDWFESTFQFRNPKLQARVVDAVREQDAQALETVFNRSAQLRRMQVEDFNPQTHEQGRDSRGRVRYKSPVSFPVRTQGEVEAHIKRKQAAVGSVKGGWGRCVAQLGGKTPSWLNRGSGSVRDNSSDKGSPNVVLTNSAPTAAALMARTGAVERALAGRAREMAKKADKAIADAAKFAAF